MNSNHSFADRFKIYSRELGDAVVPELVSIVDSDLRQFNDDRADAGVLYEYFIVATGDCGDGEIKSFDITTINSYPNLPADLSGRGVGYSIGFRSPSGVVNGNISYQGGVAVPNVKVVVEREEGNSGSALDFDGVNDKFCLSYNGIRISTFYINIYDRNSGLVFSSNNIDEMLCELDAKAWDGTHRDSGSQLIPWPPMHDQRLSASRHGSADAPRDRRARGLFWLSSVAAVWLMCICCP